MRPFLLVFSAAALAWGQPKFTITDLGTIPNLGACIATAISPNGNVAGYCHVAGQSVGVSQSQGFFYSKGTLTPLPQGSGPQVAVGVNDAGSVIGVVVPQGQDITTDLFGGSSLGFVFQGGKSTSLAQYIWPSGINNAGQIAAIQVLPTNTAQALTGLAAATVYDPASGKYTSLAGTPASSLALAIGQKGDVVGATFTLNILNLSLLFQGAQWRGGTLFNLPPPSGASSAAAFATNDNGLAGGVSFNSSYTGGLSLSSFAFTDLHPVLWTNSTPLDLTTMLGSKYGAVQGVNNSGWATGFKADTLGANGLGPLDLLLFPDSQNFTAFLYVGGKTYDLNTLVTNATGWTLTNATAVNDAGQIAGAGFVNGQEHAFLLTPLAVTGAILTISGVAGAANSVPSVSSISANGYFTVYGAGFTTDTTVQRGLQGSDIVNNSLPTNLANTCVNAGNARAFLRFVSATQINALAPVLPATGPVPVSVVVNCGLGLELTSPTISVPVAAASPEFLYWVANANGQDPVIALDAVSGAYIGAPGLIPGATFRAAKAGDILTFYGISFGKTASGGPVPGGIPSAADAVAGPVSLRIGGTPVTPSYLGVTPGSAGLYQLNATIPSGLTPGNNTVVLTINGVSTSAGGYLTVTQ